MKTCPQCQTDYFDEMLEFCLEDGAKLAVVSNRSAAPTKVFEREQNSFETLFSGDRAAVPQSSSGGGGNVQTSATTDAPPATSLKQKTVEKGFRVLETGTLVLALAHNWWQWLYVARQNYDSLAGFLLSTDFLIWFLLLAAGIGGGLTTLKFSSRKTLAYAGLVILAINFLLMLVPRR